MLYKTQYAFFMPQHSQRIVVSILLTTIYKKNSDISDHNLSRYTSKSGYYIQKNLWQPGSG